jgi:hypothetical protein
MERYIPEEHSVDKPGTAKAHTRAYQVLAKFPRQKPRPNATFTSGDARQKTAGSEPSSNPREGINQTFNHVFLARGRLQVKD